MQAPTTPNGPAGAGPRSADLPDLRRRQRADGRVLLAVLSTVRRLRGAAGSRRRTGRIVGSAGRDPSRFPTELEAPRRGGGVSRVAAIVLVTVAVIGGAYWFVSRPDAVTIPESFGGLDRIEERADRDRRRGLPGPGRGHRYRGRPRVVRRRAADHGADLDPRRLGPRPTPRSTRSRTASTPGSATKRRSTLRAGRPRPSTA